MFLKLASITLALPTVYSASAADESLRTLDEVEGIKQLRGLKKFTPPVQAQARKDDDLTIAMLDQLNDQLTDIGESFLVNSVSLYVNEDSAELGRTVFASNVGNKQMFSDFVPYDHRRGGYGGITFAMDSTEGATASGLNVGRSTAAIKRAMQTWEDVPCSDIPLRNLGPIAKDLGYMQNRLGYGGFQGWLADITHAGFLPAEFFNDLAPEGGDWIIGSTFTFVWTSDGLYTDLDRNGKPDVAFREIYYNDAFSWAIDANSGIDVETVALHEAGHGLSQDHFGKFFRSKANGKLHFAPRAVMNAVYTGVQQELTGTDLAGHCSIWGSWPLN